MQKETHTPEAPPNTVDWRKFLVDVLLCSLAAYGGPETHISVFLNQMVSKRRYLSEADLIELMALCSILPGPTSTQTLVAIGLRKGGPMLGLLTMIVWSVPALLGMTLLSFLYSHLALRGLSTEALRYIGPMAVGFILLAAWRIGRKVATDQLTFLLMLASAMATFAIRSPWMFPIALLAGGLASIYADHSTGVWHRISVRPVWRYLVLFVLLAAGSLATAWLTTNLTADLFECFYRYGYLVFGGGQVIVPVMHNELVNIRQAMSHEEFLTGYGLVQGMPGPMFSFAAYAGGMAARGGTWLLQMAGAVAGGIGIFLPGLLLIYFVEPLWQDLKQMKAVRLSIRGINAVAGGMLAAAAAIMLQHISGIPQLAVATIAMLVLRFTPIPAPVLVGAVLLAGALI